MPRIRLLWPGGSASAELVESPTARALLGRLPVRSRASTWGEEVYFEVPVSVGLEPDAREVVDPGTVCFWVQGQAVALPYGRTPASRGDECRLVTAVNLLGRLDGDPRVLATIRDGDPITVEHDSTPTAAPPAPAVARS